MVNFEIINERYIQIKKFHAVKRKILFKIKNPPNESNLLEWIKEAIMQMVAHITSTIQSGDKVGLVFYGENFKFKAPGWLSFREASKLTFSDVWDVLGAILQSNSEGLSTDSFRLEVTQVKPPSGKGRQRLYTTFNDESRQRNGLISINNTDNLCLPRALVVAKAVADKDPNYTKIRRNKGLQKVMAESLVQSAGTVVPEEGCGIEELRAFQQHLQGYKITVYLYGTKGRSMLFEGTEAGKRLNLLYHKGHFNVITSLTSAFSCNYYCEACHKPFEKKQEHRCGATCSGCGKEPPCSREEEETIYCTECNRTFRGEACFSRHLEKNKKSESKCTTVKKCFKCFKVYNVTVRKGRPHVCDEIYCKACQEFKPSEHYCFIRPQGPMKENKDTLFVFYDLETRQEKEDPNDSSIKIHEPCLCVYSQVCPGCYNSESKICERCGIREQVLRNYCVKNFVWYLLEKRKIFKQVVVVAHNGKAFDHQFILNYILTKTDLKPDLIMRGSKIILMSIGNLKFIDSLNYFPMALATLPKAFDLGSELKKGYFPYLFNTTENGNYEGPLPDVKYYGASSMKPEAREAFLKWHNEHKEDSFNLQNELITYCISDVDILKKACLKFREMFLKECNVDPFTEACTIASACNLVFRRNFLKPKTIGIIPKNGYRLKDNQSKVALQWLIHEEYKRGIRIQHAGRQNEKLIHGMKVDGFCEETQQVFEFHGCYYHGCPSCFLTRRNESLYENSEDTMDSRFEKTVSKTAALKAKGYEIVEIWECKFRQHLKASPELKYLETHPILKNTPLQPRDAFYGGRTDCTRLLYKAKQGEKIKYVDVCSLYPWVCKYGKFPVGHPQVIVGDGDCRKLNLQETNGLIKCSILPPQDLYHPVLPVKMHKKLLFSLCRTCTEEVNEGDCNHTEQQKVLHGTWCTDEVNKAVEKGYKIKEIQEIWNYKITQFDKATGGLFVEFINKFLKMKQEASGWPSNCNTQEEKDRYVEEYMTSEGIQLEFEAIVKNPGLRSLAKLMLNSFWGKFGQRENQAKVSIIDDPKEFYDLITSPSIEVNYIQEINEESIGVNWQYKEEAAEPLFTVNCVIAAYVTTQARLKLYSYLEILGGRVLYYDTDSVIYISREDEHDLPLGNLLGDLTDEITTEYGKCAYIGIYTSGGPKTYGFEVTVGEETFQKIKIKGITLNHENLQKVNLCSLLDLIEDTDKKILTCTNVIRTTTDHQLVTMTENKIFKVNIKKRKRVDNYDTVPYGFKKRVIE